MSAYTGPERRKRGRPPRSGEPQAVVSFYVADRHRKRLAEVARQKDMSVSSLCAYVISRVLDKDKRAN